MLVPVRPVLRGLALVAALASICRRDPAASIARPVKEPFGSRKLRGAPDHGQRVRFEIDPTAPDSHRADLSLGAEPGRFDLMIGSASDDIRLPDRFELLD